MLSFRHKSDKIIAFLVNRDDPDDMKPVYVHERRIPDWRQIPEDYFMEYKVDDRNQYYFKLFPEHRKNQTDRVFLCGPPGAGKSTVVSDYVAYFNELNPTSKQSILFTRLDEENFDKSLQDVQNKIHMITIDDSFCKDPILERDLADKKLDDNGDRIYTNRLIIFDDYRQGKPKIDDEVARLRNSIADIGRKFGLYEIVAQSDIPLQHISFRNFLSNSTHFIYFPLRRPSNLLNTLKNYFNLDAPERSYVEAKTRSRWICVTRQDFPFILCDDFVCMNDQVYILDNVQLQKDAKKKYTKKSQPTLESAVASVTGKGLKPIVKFDKERSIAIDQLDKLALTSRVSGGEAEEVAEQEPDDEDGPVKKHKKVKSINQKDVTFLNSLPQDMLMEAMIRAGVISRESVNQHDENSDAKLSEKEFERKNKLEPKKENVKNPFNPFNTPDDDDDKTTISDCVSFNGD